VLADGAMEGVQALFRPACVSKPGGWAAYGCPGAASTAPAGELEVGGAGEGEPWRRPHRRTRANSGIAARVVSGLQERWRARRSEPFSRWWSASGGSRGGKGLHVIADHVRLLRKRSLSRHHSRGTAQLPGWIERHRSRPSLSRLRREAKVRLPLHCTTRSNEPRPHGAWWKRRRDAA